VCHEANKLLKEDNKTAFLATHNKVSQQLEECFVELLILEETNPCSNAINMKHLEKCFKEFTLVTEDPVGKTFKLLVPKPVLHDAINKS